MRTPEFGFCFRPDLRRDDCSGPLYLWIEHYGSMRFIPTPYDIRHDEWDAIGGTIVIPKGSTGRARRLAECARSMARSLRLVKTIVSDLEKSRKRYTVDDVANAFNKAVAGSGMLGVYATILADDLSFEGSPRAATAYITTTRRFIAFNDGCDIAIEEISPSLLREFQELLIADGVSRNTISFYMRNLRAIYNKAVAEGIVSPRSDFPFDEVYTEVVLSQN